jgi:hypothetical protein
MMTCAALVSYRGIPRNSQQLCRPLTIDFRPTLDWMDRTRHQTISAATDIRRDVAFDVMV